MPNLLPLGFFPVLRTRPPEDVAGLNFLTVLHNQALAAVLAQVYSGSGNGFFLRSCSKQARAGSRILVDEVTVEAPNSAGDSLTVGLLFY